MKAFRSFKALLPWLLPLLGLSATGTAAYQVKLNIERDKYRQFAFHSDETRLKILSRLNAHKQILLSGTAMFDASDKVTRMEWRTFTQRLRSDKHFKGIQGLGFSLWIPPSELAAHIARIRAEGFTDYTVRPEGRRDAYSAIVYLEPFDWRNSRAFGYDMYSEPVRRAAMMQARDENLPALTGKVILVQETEQDRQAGTLMYVPVYRKHLPIATVEQRQKALWGWVYSPFRMDDLLDRIIPEPDDKSKPHIHLRIYDGRTTQAEKLLYDSNKSASKHEETESVLSPLEAMIDFNGTLWTLQFRQVSGSNGGIDYSKMWIILGAGSLSSILLFLLLRSNFNMRSNAARMANELTSQLQESERRFRLLADSAPVLIWQTGTDDRCCYVNKGWLEFTGRPPEHEHGEGWLEAVHPDDLAERNETYRRAVDQNSAFSMEYRLRRKDGEYRWVLDSGVPRFSEANVFLGYIGSCIDISERKQIEDRLAKTHAELQQFTHIAAHHLQEPARRIVSFVQRLQAQLNTQELSEDAAFSLHFIEQSALRQKALVRDIQLYLAADQARAKTEAIDVTALLDELLAQRNTPLRETGAQVDYNDCCSVYIDRPRLKDIFGILLDNALQYRHPERPLFIRITGEPDNGRAKYSVSDNGIGIPAEYRERVLGVFERLQVPENQNSTGIGLAIVRRIVENGNGSVVLSETQGGGTTVSFDLPG